MPIHVLQWVTNLTIFVPTPIKSNILEQYLVGYQTVERAFLVQGFTEGFHIPYELDNLPIAKRHRNHPSALQNADIVKEKIMCEVTHGRVLGPFQNRPSNLICSPLALIPKSEPGKYRLIHDLSFPKQFSVNDSIARKYTEVHYDSIDTVVGRVKFCGQGSLMAKTDIENAFRLVPIHADDRFLLGFSWDFEGKELFFIDCCLAMGLNISCQIFTRFSNALQWIMEARFHAIMSHVIDDFFFVGPSNSPLCLFSLNTFLEMCTHINIPIKQEKTVYPTTCLIIYGIEVDSKCMMTRLPQDKIIKIQAQLQYCKNRRKIRLKELQSMLGLLNFACGCVVPGRAFLRRLYDLTKGKSNPLHWIRLNADSRADLEMWSVFISSFNGCCMFLHDDWVEVDVLHLFTDAAASVGWAAVFGRQWTAQIWPSDFKNYHINILELIPIVIAFELWGPQVKKQQKIVLHSDNEATVHVINKLSSKDTIMMKWVRRLVLLSMKHNILFRARHIQGKLNNVADSLSRFNFQNAFTVAPHLDHVPVPLPEHILEI